MFEDGDRILDFVGVALIVAVLIGLGVVAVAISSGPRGSDVPEANWTVERVNDSYVRITHSGGQPVPGSQLFVTGDGLQLEANWSSVVTRGDSAVVRAGENTRLRLYWDGGRGKKEVIARWRV